jgi:hypothetical protein
MSGPIVRRGVRRAVCWIAGGALLSPFAGAPVWALIGVIGDPRAAHPIFWATPIVGAVVGLAAMLALADDVSRRAATCFGIVYPTMYVWWLAWADPEPKLIACVPGVLLLGLGCAAVVGAVPGRGARALRNVAAVGVWIATILFLPVWGLGLFTLPMAISLTAVARRDRTVSRPAQLRSKSMAARSDDRRARRARNGAEPGSLSPVSERTKTRFSERPRVRAT